VLLIKRTVPVRTSTPLDIVIVSSHPITHAIHIKDVLVPLSWANVAVEPPGGASRALVPRDAGPPKTAHKTAKKTAALVSQP
jgi:hypothetical protein